MTSWVMLPQRATACENSGMRPHLPALALTLACLPPLATAQATDTAACTRAYETERARIERDHAQRLPRQGDTAAAQAWSQSLHTALRLAADSADTCRKNTNRAAVTPAQRSTAEDCRQRVLRLTEEVDRRYAHRTLTSAEQAAQRQAHEKLLDARMACDRPTPR